MGSISVSGQKEATSKCTLNQVFRSLYLFSGFRSPWSLSNKDDKTENGAVSLFSGGGGKLVSISVDDALSGVGYEGCDSAVDMVDADKIHSPKREMTSSGTCRVERHVTNIQKVT